MQSNPVNVIHRRSRTEVLPPSNPFTRDVTGTLLALGLWLLPAVMPMNTAAAGTVVGWGAGTTSTGSFPEFGQSLIPAGLGGVTAIAAGKYHTAALKNDGTVVAWGLNNHGQTSVPAGLSGVTALASGSDHAVALKGDGTVVAWGNNDYGQTTVPAGLSGVTAIAAGYYETVALKGDGTVVAWGENSYGQTTVPAGLSGVIAIASGNGHTVALKSDGTVLAWGAFSQGQMSVPAGLSGVTAIAAGGLHTVALKSDGTVVAWGYNFYGQTTVPAGLSGVTAIAAGVYHTVALKSDGTVVAWGDNLYGQTTAPTGLNGVTAIAAGVYHTVAIAVVPIPQLPAFTGFGYSTVAPIRSSNPWQFTMVQSSLAPDLRVRVQTTTTTNVEASWEFLSGFATRLDSNWTLNTTDVPTGTRYFRAIATAPGYANTVTDQLAMIGPITVLEGIAPFGDFGYETTAPLRTGTEWKFIIVQPSLVSGLGLRVQSSTNGVDGWSNLPGGGEMADLRSISAFLASGWMHVTTNLPLGTQYFRVVASALNYADRVSAILGSFTIGPALPVEEFVITGGPARYVSELPNVQTPIEIYMRAVAHAQIFIFSDPTLAGNLIIEAAITLSAAQNASARLTINAGQTLTAPGVNFEENTSLILKGFINGDVRLRNAGNTLIANDGGTLIGHDGGSMVAGGGLNLIGHDGGSLVGKVKIASGDPAFTGVMTINGNYAQEAGTGLFIAIAGTNTLSSGAQEHDQLLISGRADLAGTIGFALFDPSNVTNRVNLFQPPAGATFDVVVATNIVTHDLLVRGPIWGDGLHFNWSVVNRADGRQAVRLVAVRIAPTLIVQATGGKVEAAYPTNFTGYTLQYSPTLTSSNWTAFSTATNRVVIDPTNAAGFFRLFKP